MQGEIQPNPQRDIKAEVQAQFFRAIHTTIPKERLAPYYFSPQTKTAVDALTLYMYNAALSESLYVPLQNFEVGLRNRLHAALSAELNTKEWYDACAYRFHPDDQNTLLQKVGELRKRKPAIEPGDVVAAMNMGFWHALFYPHYELFLWPRYIEDVFPYLPEEYKDREKLFHHIGDIRQLRNRVFHYEPIWNIKDLARKYDSLMRIIHWMCPDLAATTRAATRFRETLKAGPEPYQEKYQQNLENYFDWLVQHEAERQARKEEKKQAKKAARSAKKAASTKDKRD